MCLGQTRAPPLQEPAPSCNPVLAPLPDEPLCCPSARLTAPPSHPHTHPLTPPHTRTHTHTHTRIHTPTPTPTHTHTHTATHTSPTHTLALRAAAGPTSRGLSRSTAPARPSTAWGGREGERGGIASGGKGPGRGGIREGVSARGFGCVSAWVREPRLLPAAGVTQAVHRHWSIQPHTPSPPLHPTQPHPHPPSPAARLPPRCRPPGGQSTPTPACAPALPPPAGGGGAQGVT